MANIFDTIPEEAEQTANVFDSIPGDEAGASPRRGNVFDSIPENDSPPPSDLLAPPSIRKVPSLNSTIRGGEPLHVNFDEDFKGPSQVIADEFGSGDKNQSLVGINPQSVPTGAQITEATGIPKALTIPTSGGVKALAGVGQFLTSPEGLQQSTVAAIPGVGLLQRAKWIYDMAKTGGEVSGNLSTRLEKLLKNPTGATTEDFQGLAEDAANTALLLYGTGKLSSHEVSNLTGVRAPLGRITESTKARYAKDMAEQLNKSPGNFNPTPVAPIIQPTTPGEPNASGEPTATQVGIRSEGQEVGGSAPLRQPREVTPESQPVQPVAQAEAPSNAVANAPDEIAQKVAKDTGFTLVKKEQAGATQIPTPERMAQYTPEERKMVEAIIAQNKPEWEFTDTRKGSPTEGRTFRAPIDATESQILESFKKVTPEIEEANQLQARGYNELRRQKMTPEEKAAAIAKPIPSLESDAARFHELQDAIKSEKDPIKKMELYKQFGQEAELIKNRNTKNPGNPPERPVKVEPPKNPNLADAKKEFTDLVHEHGEAMGFVDDLNRYADGIQGRKRTGNDNASVKGQIENARIVKQVHERILRAVGQDPNIKTPQAFAEALPKFKKLIQDHLAKEGNTAEIPPDVNVEDSFNPEIVGMGGAVPKEFERNPETATGIKNATVDAERAKRGLPPAMAPAKRTFGEVWDAAMAKIDRDPDYPDRLIDELKEKPRALTDLEDATLLHRQIDLQNEYGKATRDLAQAHADGRTDAVIEEKARVASLRDQLYELYEIGKKSGTETGRGLNARKMMAFEDFSLAKMEMEKRATANNGAPLTEAQAAEIKALHEEIVAKQKAYDDYVQKTEARDAERAVKEALDKVEREAKAPKASSYVIQLAEKWVAKQDIRADAARARLRKKFGSLGSSPDPTILADLAEIGASHLGHIGLDFAKWSEKIIKDVGEIVKPHLQEVFDASRAIWEKSGAPTAVKKTVLKVKDMTGEQRKADLSNKIREKFDEGKKSEITQFVQKLARQFVEEGVRGWENLLDAVHGVLTGIDPEISRRETMDAISGYGQYKRLSQDEISVALREAKGEMQQVAKIEDITSGVKPKPTGIERRTPSETERAKIKLVNELKKKHPELFEGNGLKGALESRKTYVRNRINDLRSEIANKELAIKNKTQPPTDAELNSLRAELEMVKTEHDALFKKEMTDEQRIKLSIDAIKRQMEEYDRRIAEKDFSGPNPSRVANAPEVLKAKAQRDALRDQFTNLRDLDENYQRAQEAAKLEREKVGLERTIAEQERKLRENDLAAKPHPVNRPANPILEPLKQQRDRLAKEIAERRKRNPMDVYADRMAKRLERMNEAISEKEAKISAGDVSTQPRQVNRPLNPELEQAKQRLEQLNDQIREMRKPKRSPEEIALKTFKTRTANRIAEYERRLREQDFAPKAKRTPILDNEAMRLKAAAEAAKLKYMRSLELDRLSKRSTAEKVMEQIAGGARAAALSGYHTLAKLASFSAARLAEIPLTEAVGAAISKVPGFRRIFQGANMESGATLKAVARFYHDFATKGMRQAGDIMRKGESPDKILYGKPDLRVPRWFDFFNRLHGVEKEPLRKGTQSMYELRAEENAIKGGLDVNNEFVRAQLNKEAYDYAQSSILLENNKFAEMVNAGLRRLEQKNPKTSKVELQNAAIANLFRTLVTKGIVRTPANYFAQTIARTPIGLAAGLAKTVHAHFSGIENLHPIEKNAIAKLVKVGAVGSAFFLWGMIDATQDEKNRVFGGYYSSGRKKTGPDVPWGKIRIDGVTLPHIATHNPLTESAQMGSTLMRVFIARSKKGDDGSTAALEGGVKSLVGLVSKAPIANPLMRLDSTGNKVVGGLLQGLVPQLVQNIAEDTDLGKDGLVERAPKSAFDQVAVGVPGLRQTVKEKKK